MAGSCVPRSSLDAPLSVPCLLESETPQTRAGGDHDARRKPKPQRRRESPLPLPSPPSVPASTFGNKLTPLSSVGIERILRLVQAIVQILHAYPALLSLLLTGLAGGGPGAATKPPDARLAAGLAVLPMLRQRLALARRFFRVFRFLDAFRAAQRLLVAGRAGGAGRRPAWVRAAAGLRGLDRAFNGMYLLLEAATLAEALDVPGLALWPPARAARLALEAQRFWCLALVCGAAADALRALEILAYTPVPVVGDVFADEDEEKKKAAKAGPEAPPRPAGEEKTAGEDHFDVLQEQARLRKVLERRKKGRVLWQREVRAKLRGLGWSFAAQILDTVLPGSVLGWIDADYGTVGVVTFITTILTGKDVWERCGREAIAAAAAAETQ